jgi:hypothetical protein
MSCDCRPLGSPARNRRQATDLLRKALLELARGEATILGHSEKSWAEHHLCRRAPPARARVRRRRGWSRRASCSSPFSPSTSSKSRAKLVADATITEVDHRLDPPRMQVICELLLLEEG